MFIWFEELFMSSIFILLEFWHLNHLSRQEFDGCFELLCPQCLNLLEDQKYLMIKRKEKGKECTFQALYMPPLPEDQGKQQNVFELQLNGLKYYHLKGASTVALQHRSRRKHGFYPWVGMILWRRAWQPTPVFLPGESRGQWSLASCSPWGREEWNSTEYTEHSCT